MEFCPAHRRQAAGAGGSSQHCPTSREQNRHPHFRTYIYYCALTWELLFYMLGTFLTSSSTGFGFLIEHWYLMIFGGWGPTFFLWNLHNWLFTHIHGSLNVPIEHHPTIRYMVNAMATFSGDVQYTQNGTFNDPWYWRVDHFKQICPLLAAGSARCHINGIVKDKLWVTCPNLGVM